MGYPYDTLVPAAILLDNPGLSRDEFTELLNQTHSNGIFSSEYHRGLHGLAEILHLSLTEQFKEKEKERDNWKKVLFVRQQDGLFRYEVHIIKYVPLEEKIITTFSSNYSVGDKGDSRCYCGGNFFKVLEILLHEKKEEKKNLVEQNVKSFSIEQDASGKVVLKPIENLDEEEIVYEKQTMRVLPFEEESTIKTFNSLDSLVKEFPEYHPDFTYDWTLKDGKLRVGFSDEFKWIMKNNKYYLDEDFVRENLSTGERRLLDKYDWTDLILTRDAIRTGFWKVLQRRGLDFLEEFLDCHPEVRANYDIASWNSTISLYAKMKEMTNTELLRFRLEAKLCPPPNLNSEAQYSITESGHIRQIHSE